MFGGRDISIWKGHHRILFVVLLLAIGIGLVTLIKSSGERHKELVISLCDYKIPRLYGWEESVHINGLKYVRYTKRVERARVSLTTFCMMAPEGSQGYDKKALEDTARSTSLQKWQRRLESQTVLYQFQDTLFRGLPAYELHLGYTDNERQQYHDFKKIYILDQGSIYEVSLEVTGKPISSEAEQIAEQAWNFMLKNLQH